MKKSLVLAMAMALGVTASAYAANPFSDVPAGHWAYDSVNKLAAAGIIDGYGDDTFGGDRLMTRYEMAQIVAKAMARGANVDRLAAEFADELDSLGVRVAALEKKADNVRITGQVRYHYANYSGDLGDHASALRSRLWFAGQINDDWKYTGMIQNTQDFTNNTGDETTKFQRAYLDGKVGGVDVRAGRLPLFLVNGNLYDTRADGIVASYGKDVKLTGFYVKPTDMDEGLVTGSDIGFAGSTYADWTASVKYDKAYGAKVNAKLGAVDAEVGYTVFKDGEVTFADDKGKAQFVETDVDNDKIFNVGVGFDLAKDLRFTADYMKSNIDEVYGYEIDDDGYVLGLSYAGAKASDPGSFGVYGNYYDQARGTVAAHTMNGDYGTTGFKGYMVGVNYTFAKNIVGAIEYYDLESKELPEKKDMRTLWSQLVFTF